MFCLWNISFDLIHVFLVSLAKIIWLKKRSKQSYHCHFSTFHRDIIFPANLNQIKGLIWFLLNLWPLHLFFRILIYMGHLKVPNHLWIRLASITSGHPYFCFLLIRKGWDNIHTFCNPHCSPTYTILAT